MSVRVCRKAFLHIHAVSGGRIDRALKSFVEAGGSPQMDKRGRHEPGNKTPEETISYVKQHIASFPQYESHYSRTDNPNRKYLSPDLTVSKMHSMCTKKNVPMMGRNQSVTGSIAKYSMKTSILASEGNNL